MTVRSLSVHVETRGNGDVVDMTTDLAEVVRNSKLSSGIVIAFVPGSTAGLTTIEYEPGLVEDISEMFEKVAPQELEYHHNRRWHDGNGHAHVRASLLGPSITVPFKDGKLMLGVWQQVVLIDFDNRSRERDIVCQVMGE